MQQTLSETRPSSRVFYSNFKPCPVQGFFVFGPTPVSLPKADASDVEADLFEDSR